MLVSFLFFSGCGKSEISLDLESTETVSFADVNPEKYNEKIYVYACGEVTKPGVYLVSANARVFEVIKIAGGLCADADMSSINQAETVSDGEKLFIPSLNAADAADSGEAAESSDGLVNINTADEAELMTISGVGETRALAIIAYREEHGIFEKTEDIKNVAGIKDGLFSKIKGQIKVR